MRGKQAPKRERKVDTLYKSVTVSRFINYVMRDGKKSLARRVVYAVLEDLSKATKEDPLDALNKALSNVKPEIELRSRRIGGANYQIPIPVEEDRQEALAMRWLIEAARSQKGSDFKSLLFSELKNAVAGSGVAIKKKEDIEKMAEANKAFAHFRW